MTLLYDHVSMKELKRKKKPHYFEEIKIKTKWSKPLRGSKNIIEKAIDLVICMKLAVYQREHRIFVLWGLAYLGPFGANCRISFFLIVE